MKPKSACPRCLFCSLPQGSYFIWAETYFPWHLFGFCLYEIIFLLWISGHFGVNFSKTSFFLLMPSVLILHLTVNFCWQICASCDMITTKIKITKHNKPSNVCWGCTRMCMLLTGTGHVQCVRSLIYRWLFIVGSGWHQWKRKYSKQLQLQTQEQSTCTWYLVHTMNPLTILWTRQNNNKSKKGFNSSCHRSYR